MDETTNDKSNSAAQNKPRRATAPTASPDTLDVIAELAAQHQVPDEGAGPGESSENTTADVAGTDQSESSAETHPASDNDTPGSEESDQGGPSDDADADDTATDDAGDDETAETASPRLPASALLFQAPDLASMRARQSAKTDDSDDDDGDDDDDDRGANKSQRGQSQGGGKQSGQTKNQGKPSSGSGKSAQKSNQTNDDESDDAGDEDSDDSSSDDSPGTTNRRRRRRGGRGRRRSGRPSGSQAGNNGDETDDDDSDSDDEGQDDNTDNGGNGDEVAARRRHRRRRGPNGDGDLTDDEQAARARNEVTALKGSTRLEAKRQRRKEGREAGRRRTTISESEFLARRESVERKMLVREQDGLNQIAVLEDGLLVEHYVARHTQTSMVGNVYLGRVQNVLPSMEAAFVDIGKGRNAVLYAGEVNWEAAGMDGQPRRIEQALKSGDTVLVQVTKDPIGHKGARLTSQVTLAGRHLVYVPSGAMTGISRKLPANERNRLKSLLKEIVPSSAGVIVRTAAEGASEQQLRDDVDRLKRIWADIEKKTTGSAKAPTLLKGEPELAVRVVRDVFNEDFESLTVSGNTAWKTISSYVKDLAPDLVERMHKWTGNEDLFSVYRVDEQLAKGMDRTVWLPSGGSLVIDRTEAMTVIDINTGKFTGSGGTLEETVTKNNLEAAEEIVRQLRLRDIGGIIVIDFIDMVLPANRDLVLRRLLECLGRDRTRHQVAEVTSLGLVQMTRKRVGQGLVEAFSTPCQACAGRGFIVHDHPIENKSSGSSEANKGGRGRGRGNRNGNKNTNDAGSGSKAPKDTTTKAATDTDSDDDGEQSEAARRAVRATLATIAAAAASAHDNNAEDSSSDSAADNQAGPGDADTAESGSGTSGETAAETTDAEPATTEHKPGAGHDDVTSDDAVTDIADVVDTSVAPAAKPRRSRRAVTTGVVTPGQDSAIVVTASNEDGEPTTT